MHPDLCYRYINLSHRTDRNQHSIEQFDKYQIKNYERIEADNGNGNPVIGCANSHISALEKFISSGADYSIVLEDDFQFTVSLNQYELILNRLLLSEIDWDIVLLAGKIINSHKYNDFLHKCINVQTTSGYLIHKKFSDVLIQNFKESSGAGYPIDMHWKWLQKSNYNFFIFMPKCGQQLRGFSDIRKKKVNYRS